jgi:hypothetical protein
MVKFIVFNVLLFGCWAFAWLRGGAPERIVASIVVVGSILTAFAATGPATRYTSVELGIFLVDVAALVGFLIVALRAERFWPLWVTALQAIGTAAHAMKLTDTHLIPWGYAFALAFWSYPMLLLIAWGTWNHQRRLARFGADKSWSSSSDRWDRRPPAGPIA